MYRGSSRLAVLGRGARHVSIFGAWLLATGSPYAVSRAEPLAEHLDQLMQQARTGIVCIEVRRPWVSYTSGLAEAPGSPAPARRILGNGVVWDREGHVFTVTELAQPGDSLIVWGSTGVRGAADYIGQDPDLGISLIQVREPASFVPLPRAASSPLVNRGWVLTIGYRADDGAQHLSLAQVLGRSRRGSYWRVRLDGQVDPSMAGSAVLDGGGGWIGLLLGEGRESLLLRGEGRKQSVEYCMGASRPTEAGWVLPVDQVATVLESLAAGASGQEGFLGVRADMPEKPGGEAGRNGVAIAEVVPGSPAHQAGLLPHDRITLFDGVPVDGWDRLTELVARAIPGRAIPLRFLREGREMDVSITPADRGHMIWREKQRQLAGGRERVLQRQIEGLHHQLELLRHQLASFR